MKLDYTKNSRVFIIAVIYLSLFLDNVLLTVVVPIIPDYLLTLDANTTASIEEDENGRVGLLLSSKALLQLICNPVVGILIGRMGYTAPLLLGNLCLLLAASLFAFGKTYEELFIARSVHGAASACIQVSGISLVASQYPQEGERSKIMGFVLSSIALGVLLGYPAGSVLYDLGGKTTPFLLVCFFTIIVICLQTLTSDIQTDVELNNQQGIWRHLLSNPFILIVSGAIWCATLPIAILESCLPIWLRIHIKPKIWQLGTVFIPDSVGYFIGASFFGTIAYIYGRSKVAILAMVMVGISAILIPSADTMLQLTIPHLVLGLGIGIVDAALIPLLASLEDRSDNYGPVYSIQQMAVSLAYSLGPIMGGELVRAIGFPWVMRIIGTMNLAYCSLLIYLTLERGNLLKKEKEDYNTFQKSIVSYERFRNDDDL